MYIRVLLDAKPAFTLKIERGSEFFYSKDDGTIYLIKDSVYNVISYLLNNDRMFIDYHGLSDFIKEDDKVIGVYFSKEK